MGWCPPCFSGTMVFVIMLLYLVTAGITSYILTTSQYTSDTTDTWVMMGGLTSTSIEFRVRIPPASASTSRKINRLVVYSDKSLDTAVSDQTVTQNNETNDDADNSLYVDSVTVTGLESNTKYYYATYNNGDNIVQKGSFTTAPEEGVRTPFSFVASGCSWTGSKHAIYQTILDEEPDALFFAHLGDFHYEDLNVEDLGRRIEAIDSVMNSGTQQALFAQRPLVYMWDDHDWLGNDSTGDPSQIGYEAALESYRQAMPYYSPLPSNTSMYHAFTIGSVRFIMSDLRSEAMKAEGSEEADENTMFSETQREWLYAQLAQADRYDFVVWITTKPWIYSPGKFDGDAWNGYPADRQALSDFIATSVPKNNILAIGSDAHMIAFDDGSNTYFGSDETTEGIKSFPLLQTGPMDRLASFKGGPYSEGCTAFAYERNHQYSVIELDKDSEDGQVCLQIKTYRIEGPSKKKLIFTKNLCGEDIYGESNPGTGSCKTKILSPINRTMMIISGALMAVAVVLACLTVNKNRVLTSIMIIFMLVGTLAIGFFVPRFLSVGQFNAFETVLIALLEICTVVIHLTTWRFCGSSSARDDDEDNDNNEGTTSGENQQTEEDEDQSPSIQIY